MATYAIGDVHGCYDQLQQLLQKIQYNQQHDLLWFTGDLTNGGPKPLETLRFISSLSAANVCVLGNHDLTLLGVAAGKIHAPRDSVIGFDPVLAAPDREALLAWLRMRPLVHFDPKFNTLLVHAGVLPQWNLAQVQRLAREVETAIRGPDADMLFSNMFGNTPEHWDENLQGWERIRFIINSLTRMRFCDPQGKLDLMTKGEMNAAPPGYMPWFKVPNRQIADVKIVFGHWAALLGETGVANVLAIDTGCMWGHSLTALRLEDGQRFAVQNIKTP